MAERGTKFEVTIEKLVYGGDGLGRHDHQTVFAPYVLPQERVAVEPDKTVGGIIRGHPVEILEPSPRRVEAPCPYFGWCGGCHYQHAPYDYQLQAKREILAESLRRQGRKDAPPDIATVSADPWNYRNRSLFHVSGGRIGYLEARSHILCPVETCPISSPTINRVLETLLEMTRDSRWPNFLRSIQLFTDESRVALDVFETDRPLGRRFFEWCGERIPRLVPGALDYAVNGITYRVSSRSFFQVNRYLVGKLVETALEGAQGERAADLYAGVGLFSIPLARRFREVTAVEWSTAAVRDMQWNLEHAGAVNVRGMRAQSEQYLQQATEAPDFLLLDPPRTGLGQRVVRRIGELKPRRVVIVSCDPATLARDLGGLTAAGYRLARLTLVDLFPQTFHLETVARLEL